MLSPVPCSVGGISCIEFIAGIEEEECVVSTTLRYAVENIGQACVDITSLSSKVGSDALRDIALGNINRMFCPNDVLVFPETRPLDLCNSRGQLLPVELKMNNEIEASGKMSFHQASPRSKTPSLSPFKAPSMVPDTSTPSKTPVSVDPIKVCSVRPSAVWLLFNPGNCFQRKARTLKARSQKYRSRSKKGDYFEPGCHDFCPVESSSRIVVTSHVASTLVFDDVLTAGQEFELFDQDGLGRVNFEIFNLDGRKSQSLLVDLSCSKPTRLGHVFASLVFVDFDGAEDISYHL